MRALTTSVTLSQMPFFKPATSQNTDVLEAPNPQAELGKAFPKLSNGTAAGQVGQLLAGLLH